MRDASDELARIRKMMEELEAEGMGDILAWACLGLGIKKKRTSKPWADDIPMGELYEPHSIDQLCDRVQYLVEEEGILSAIVIGGLLNQLVDMFDFMGNPNKVPDSIDRNMDTMNELQKMRSVPHEFRPNKVFTDEALDQMIEQMKDSFSRMRPFQEQSEELGEALEKQWNKKFPASYFHEIIFGHK
jgi:hypothetical protein